MQKLRIIGQCCPSRKLLILTITCMLLLMASGGCSRESPDEVNSYGHDGYMGYSNSNPNTINRRSSLSYGENVNLINQVLAPLEGIERQKLKFNGNELHVMLKVNKNMTEADIVHLRAKAQSIVQYNMPQYEVHVTARK